MKIFLTIAAVLAVGFGFILLKSSGDKASSSPTFGHVQPDNSSSQSANDSLGLVDDDAVLGDLNAPITLIEFGDYQCTFCTRFFKETEPVLVEKYVNIGKLKIVFRDFVVNGPESQNAAEAAQCAHEQGRFWDYHDKLYTERRGYNQGTFVKENLIAFARELGLDGEQFASCYESGKYRDEITKDIRDASLVGGRGTPTFILEGRLIPGAQPLDFFEQIIKQELEAQGG